MDIDAVRQMEVEDSDIINSADHYSKCESDESNDGDIGTGRASVGEIINFIVAFSVKNNLTNEAKNDLLGFF